METKPKAKPGQKRKASPGPKTTTAHGKRKGRRGFKVFALRYILKQGQNNPNNSQNCGDDLQYCP
ncbi:hypothetical protein E3E25_08570 [Thermococcus sp. MAR1]|nr:hypothetical protein [Thermococcus sp. MAR1]